MRLVHEIEGKATVSVGYRPYAIAKGYDKSSGVIVDILIIVAEEKTNPLSFFEEIHIEGDGAYILDALKTVVDMIECAAEEMVKSGDIVEDWQDLKAKKTRFKFNRKKAKR